MLGRSFLTEPWFQWGTALVLGFPIAIIILGEVLSRLERRRSRMVGPVRLLRNAFLPLLVAVLFLQNVLEIERTTGRQSPIVQVVATVTSVVGLAILLSIVQGFVTSSKDPESWRGRAPRLLVDIVRFSLLGVGSLLVLSSIWGLSITGTFAALGVGGIVLGFALQDTLASLMGGIAILSEKPFGVGDWIELDGVEGKITDINWRTVRMQNRQEDLIVVPNIVFGNQLIINNSRPEIEHIETITLGFSYDDPPNAVKAMLTEIVEGTPNLVPGTPIDIRCVSYDDFSIGYEVWLSMINYDVMPKVRDHFMTRVWYAAKRYDISIPFPIRTLHHFDGGRLPDIETPELVQRRVRNLPGETISGPVAERLEAVESQSHETGKVSGDNRLLRFAAGELLQLEGGDSEGLGIILSGIAVGLNAEHEVIHLTTGEVFGEQALLGTRHNLLTIRAVTDVEAVLIRSSVVDEIARSNVGFAEEIQAIVQSRRAAADRAGSIDLTRAGRAR